MFDTEKYNEGIRRRSRKAKDKLQASLSQFSIGETGELLRALNSIKYKRNFGQIEAIGFTITKGGVMTSKGVGRGILVDSAKTNGSKIGRKKKDWYNPVIDEFIPELADYVAEQQADSLINAIKIN
ncbi:MAG: hypothetical protein J5I47_13440 [Vicingus serpentipes]|nr:hypothetical protein [Vicingus serpentipes]